MTEQTSYPTMRTVVKRRREVTYGVALLVLALGFWAAFRTGVPDLYGAACLVAVVAFFVCRLAIEVVDLVSETLMPR